MRFLGLATSLGICALVLLLAAGDTFGQAHNKGTQAVGIRIGVHHFTTGEEAEVTEGLRVEPGGQEGFAAEAFYNYYLLDQLAFEVSLASAHRSDVTFKSTETGAVFFGTANVYPMSVGIKVAPLASMLSEKYQPWFAGGGSLVITRELFEAARDIDLEEYFDRGEKSKTDLGYWLGAGFDSFISRSFGVTGSFKYFGIEYDSPVAGYRDHSGWQITVGVSYIVRKR